MNLEEREINLLGKRCVRNGAWVFKNRSGLPPGYLPKTSKFMSHRATCTFMLVAMFFTVAQLWHQPRGPTAENWVRTCDMYTQWIFFLSIKNQVMVFAGKLCN